MLQTREISSSLLTPTRRKLRTCLICFVMMMGMLHRNQGDKKMSYKFMWTSLPAYKYVTSAATVAKNETEHRRLKVPPITLRIHSGRAKEGVGRGERCTGKGSPRYDRHGSCRGSCECRGPVLSGALVAEGTQRRRRFPKAVLKPKNRPKRQPTLT